MPLLERMGRGKSICIQYGRRSLSVQFKKFNLAAAARVDSRAPQRCAGPQDWFCRRTILRPDARPETAVCGNPVRRTKPWFTPLNPALRIGNAMSGTRRSLDNGNEAALPLCDSIAVRALALQPADDGFHDERDYQEPVMSTWARSPPQQRVLLRLGFRCEVRCQALPPKP